jgi:hypothetical protein
MGYYSTLRHFGEYFDPWGTIALRYHRYSNFGNIQQKKLLGRSHTWTIFVAFVRMDRVRRIFVARWLRLGGWDGGTVFGIEGVGNSFGSGL